MKKEDLTITIKCSLCHVDSNEDFIMSGFFDNERILICLDCLTEAIHETQKVKRQE